MGNENYDNNYDCRYYQGNLSAIDFLDSKDERDPEEVREATAEIIKRAWGPRLEKSRPLYQIIREDDLNAR